MTGAQVVSTPTLATVKGVELASVGYWNISTADDWHPSAEDLQSAVAAMDCPAVRRPVLKFGHIPPFGEGDPAIGLIDNMVVADDGQNLIGDFVGVPGWLADADSEGRAVIASAYPDRSGEFEHDYVCQLGHTHPFVVHAVALLGVVRPGIGTLESLYDLFTNPPELEAPIMAKAAQMSAATTVDQVRRAYYDGPGTDWNLWIREMYIDPPELIVQNDGDDTIQRIPYTVSGESDVEFGEAQTVKIEYVAARAKGEKPLYASASRAESRTGQDRARPSQTSSAAEAEEPQGKEGTMPTLKEGVAQLLGTDADADDETILAALGEKLNPGDPAPDTDPAPPADTPATPAATDTAAAAAGSVVTVDRAVFEQMQRDSALGAAAAKRQEREDREKKVDAAISHGKIPPFRRDHYLSLMELDEKGTSDVLASIPDQTVASMVESGHSVSPDNASQQELGWFDTVTTSQEG